jgi:hypothetical protein
MSEPQPASPLSELLAELDQKVQRDYEASRDAASNDPQQAGHIAEATWQSLLNLWLPTGYSAGTRRYIVPETNDDYFEMDLLVFRPTVPTVLREQTRVPHGAVAAAFSIRRTADRAGLADAIDRAVRLRRSIDRAIISHDAKRQVQPAYPVGFLSLSHDWASSARDVVRTVTSILIDLDNSCAQHPAESLDLCCVGDLGTWSRKRVPWVPPISVQRMTGDEAATQGCPMTLLLDPVASQENNDPPPNPVGIFIRELYTALEENDSQLGELAYSLRKAVPIPSGEAPVRLFPNLSS